MINQSAIILSCKLNFHKFIRFVGLSGIGWITDFVILIALVTFTTLQPYYANMISSCIAALGVFIASREGVFVKGKRNVYANVLIYLIYTLLVIMAASYLIASLSKYLMHTSIVMGLLLQPMWTVAIAKIVVTPFNMLLNFLVSKWLIET